MFKVQQLMEKLMLYLIDNMQVKLSDKGKYLLHIKASEYLW